MRKVRLPLTGSTFDIPVNQEYKLVESTAAPNLASLGEPHRDYTEYTFFPTDSHRASEVLVCSQTKDINGGILREIVTSRPLSGFLLIDLPRPKEFRMPKKALLPGTRVRFAQPMPNGKTLSGHGTIILYSHRNRIVSIYADKPVPGFENFSPAPKKYRIPKGYGITLSSRSVVILSSEHYNYANLKEMPLGAGVAISKDFIFRHANGRDYRVKEGYCGRLLSVNEGWAMVSWYNWVTTQHAALEMSKGHQYDYCMAVPTSELQYGTLDPSGRIRAYWGQDFENNLKVGDYVVYNNDSPCRMEHLERNRYFTRGSILQITGRDDSGRVLTVKLVGGCKLDEIGSKVRIDSSSTAPLMETFIPKAATIEIVAELEFKKKNLQGQKALVLIPTDQDGDVGVQFNEDIDGGSLDGIGENRRCLYIPASVVKVSE